MTDRLPPEGFDDELEARLREAFARVKLPGAPDSLRVTATGLVTRPGRDRGRRRPLRPSFALAAGALALSIGLVGALVSTGWLSPEPGGDDASPVPSPSASPCAVSVAIARGRDAFEVGGPRAFLPTYPTPYTSAAYPWKLYVRFDPNVADTDDIALWAVRLDSGHREDADYNGPSGVPDPPLGGGVHLFTQPFTTPGCWQLSAAVRGQIVGSATIEVINGAGALQSGTFVTTGAVDGLPCFGFTLFRAWYAEPTAVEAWQWPATDDGTCVDRPIAPRRTSATIHPLAEPPEGQPHPGHQLDIELDRVEGSQETQSVVLYASECCVSGVITSAGERPVFFDRLPPRSLEKSPEG